MICRELYSPEQYTQVFPKVNLAIAVANALGYPLLGAIYDHTGAYDGALLLVLAFALLSVAGVLLIYRVAAPSREQVDGSTPPPRRSPR